MGCCSSSNLEIKKIEKAADEPILKTPNLSLNAQDEADIQNETPLLGTSGNMSFKNVDDGINTKELDKMLEDDEEEEIDSYEDNQEDIQKSNN